jgi:glycosyltransferase involved in cell wall biosynthesis
MGALMLRELLRQGVEVDVYLNADQTPLPPIEPRPGLRVIVRRSPWSWGRWYSRTKPAAFFTSLVARSLNGILLSVRLLVEHRRRPYDAVFQLSQVELLLLGRLRRIGPPIVVHPCSHAAGELRWHRNEQDYALRSERRWVHFAIRAWLTLRSRSQPGELARADIVIGPSTRFVDLVHADYDVPRRKLRVMRHPVDLARFAPPPTERPPGPATLLFISRISARKGVEEVVALSHRLDDLRGSLRLLVVGGATMWSDYRAHLDDLNPAIAEYVGPVPGSEMPDLLRAADVLLVPSRYEPGSIVTGEALASGLPVVLSDEVGPSEVVCGPHVRTHRAGDVDGLEAAVRSLLTAVRQDGQALAESARADAERYFSVATIVSQLVAIVASASSRPAGRDAGPGTAVPVPASRAGV